MVRGFFEIGLSRSVKPPLLGQGQGVGRLE